MMRLASGETVQRMAVACARKQARARERGRQQEGDASDAWLGSKFTSTGRHGSALKKLYGLFLI